ncbi:metallophosphoesterase [bacterium]|nr:metallophosphoesterase [bacterium]
MNGIIIFLVLILCIYTAMNLIAFIWLRFMFRPSGTVKHIFSGIFSLFAVSIVVGRVLVSIKGWPVASIILQIGYTWLGFLFYFVVLGILTGVLYQSVLLMRRFNWISFSDTALLPGFPYIGSVILGLLVAFALHGMFSLCKPVVNKYNITITGIVQRTSPLTIVQLSDLHLDRMKSVKWWENIVDQTNDLEPDIIALTGDIFDEHPGELEPFMPGLKRLSSTYGVFGTTGNHEFYTDTGGGLAMLADAGVMMLRNNGLIIPGVACIIGIDDPTGIRVGKLDPPDFEKLGRNIPRNLPVIVMNHQPMYIDEIKLLGADIQLSGHTHDGQIWPFKWLNKLVFKYQNGLFQFDDFFLYVSSGTGTWGPPFRIGTRSEIAVIRLYSQ